MEYGERIPAIALMRLGRRELSSYPLLGSQTASGYLSSDGFDDTRQSGRLTDAPADEPLRQQAQLAGCPLTRTALNPSLWILVSSLRRPCTV